MKSVSRVLSKYKKLRANSSFWVYLSLSLCALTLPFLAGFYPVVRFTDEQIDVHVYQDHVMVDGHYVYKNPFPFPVVQGFSIPLPVDDEHPMPINISVEQQFPEQRPIPVQFIWGRHRFEMVFSAGEEVGVRVQYRQHAPVKNARYILTTTQPWGRPLMSGVYRVFASGVRITSSNYPLLPSEPGILSFNRNNFMPENDWHFSWKVL